jgi:hypothetical protein
MNLTVTAKFIKILNQETMQLDLENPLVDTTFDIVPSDPEHIISTDLFSKVGLELDQLAPANYSIIDQKLTVNSVEVFPGKNDPSLIWLTSNTMIDSTTLVMPEA